MIKDSPYWFTSIFYIADSSDSGIKKPLARFKLFNIIVLCMFHLQMLFSHLHNVYHLKVFS